jgi:hypothetical protein
MPCGTLGDSCIRSANHLLTISSCRDSHRSAITLVYSLNSFLQSLQLLVEFLFLLIRTIVANGGSYTKEKWLLEQARWKWAKRYLKNDKTFQRILKNINATKRKKQKVNFKFRQWVPRTISEAYDFDFITKNSRWKDVMDKEGNLLVNAHECFTVLKKGE